MVVVETLVEEATKGGVPVPDVSDHGAFSWSSSAPATVD